MYTAMKIGGMVLVIACTTSIGISFARALTERVRELERTLAALSSLGTELSYSLAPPAEAVAKRMKEKRKARRLFRRVRLCAAGESRFHRHGAKRRLCFTERFPKRTQRFWQGFPIRWDNAGWRESFPAWSIRGRFCPCSWIRRAPAARHTAAFTGPWGY